MRKGLSKRDCTLRNIEMTVWLKGIRSLSEQSDQGGPDCTSRVCSNQQVLAIVCNDRILNFFEAIHRNESPTSDLHCKLISLDGQGTADIIVCVLNTQGYSAVFAGIENDYQLPLKRDAFAMQVWCSGVIPMYRLYQIRER